MIWVSRVLSHCYSNVFHSSAEAAFLLLLGW